MSDAEIARLPDADLFRDALLLNESGRWSPAELDETDALVLAVIRSLRSARRRS